MENKKTQIIFGLDVEAIGELGANWLNITFDICEYLKSKGFQYSRTLGFLNDRELNEEEIKEVGKEVIDMALGVEHLLYFDACIIDNVMSFGAEDLADGNLATKSEEN